MRRVLYIAYIYPPCGGAGVQRTAKFVRYLPDYGWLPTVLTVDPSCYGIQDASQTQETPEGVEVVRTPNLDPVARFTYVRPAAQGTNGAAGSNGSGRGFIRGGVRRILKTGWLALEKNILVPDPALLWYPRAVAAGQALLRRRHFDLICATGEPYSAYLIAKTLATRAGLPFVIDMRDPWTMAPYRADKRAAWRTSLEAWQERRILAACRACVFAFRHDDLYGAAFPEWTGKFHYIPNGYDSADFAGVEPRRFDKFTIVHSGTFLPGYRSARPFLLALRELRMRRPDLASGAQVLFVGKLGEEGPLIQEFGLTDLVRQVGYLPHRESIRYLLGADLLLLVGGQHRWEETGKVYEYLATSKPILALIHPEGSAARLLSACPGARIVDREDAPATAAALWETLDARTAPARSVGRDWVARFERRRLTASLATVFDAAWRDGRPGRTR